MKKCGIVAAVVLAVLTLPVALPLGTIAWRLSQNQPAARSLAESLTARYPAYKFVGAASYERDVIYIGVYSPADNATRAEIQNWLADQKAQRQLRATILLRFRDPATGSELEEVEI